MDILPDLNGLSAETQTPESIANAFVEPDSFPTVASQNNVLIIGPRGSGKTTLLRMLQDDCLAARPPHPEGTPHPSVDYCSIFVPSDVTFSRRMRQLQGEDESASLRIRLLTAAFTVNALHALVTSIQLRRGRSGRPGFHSITLDRQQEAALAGELASQWRITSPIASLASLRRALDARYADISELARKLTFESPQALSGQDGLSFLDQEMFSLLQHAISAVNDFVGEPERRWALCFDELEMAPPQITAEILLRMRANRGHLIIKASMAPAGNIPDELIDQAAPQEGHDYQCVALWHSHKSTARAFSRQLAERILTQAGFPDIKLSDVLGNSPFETRSEDWSQDSFKTVYRSGSRVWRRFKDLAAIDASFRDYLSRHNIDISQMQKLAGDERAETLRKITGVVAIRGALLKERDDRDALGKRTRKRTRPLAIYAGADSLLAIGEGNPRWLKGMLSVLLREYQRVGSRVAPARQALLMGSWIRVMKSFLSTIRSPFEGFESLTDLLELLGARLHERVCGERFDPEPPLSFTVDKGTDAATEAALRDAVNLGALVYIPQPDSKLPLRSIRGERLRLHFLLATDARLPLRLGRSINLSTLLPRRQGVLFRG